ncbi:PAS domain-containing sensor histidine kinase [Pleionea litopenaei]|uniref:histidine kinase n=1 Tax=Pleionea litopenaei TaxID=3070815 RepID=A0AA51X5P8_9GAMM|nr:PAS domain S-box protein [Pleionea sp. HL-JVS1]WMS86228.1 PAS domain S-box protein [Pleionea sp. HL-JVS1]
MLRNFRFAALQYWVFILFCGLLLLPILIQNVFNLIEFDQERMLEGYVSHKAFVLSLIVLIYPLMRVITLLGQQQTRTSETRRNVAELIDHAADMILITRPNGQIVNANRRACEILGYSVEQLKNMRNLDLDTECTLYRNPRMHQQLFTGQTVTFETHYQSLKGEKIPVENHVSIAGWMEGTYYLEITRDITRRRLVEQELHASKEALERVRNRLESRMQERTQKLVEEVQRRELTEKRIFEIRLLLENLVNSMPSVIIALNDKLRVTQWNLEAEKVFHIPETLAVGQNITHLLPRFKSHIFSLIQQSEKGRKSIKEFFDVELDGKQVKFNVMLYPLSQTTDSNLPGVVIRLDDVTEKVQFDEVLVQTEKMLSLGGLAAGMAHEINNPLGAILQSTQNILRRLSNNFPRNRKIAKTFELDLDAMSEYLENQQIIESLDAIKEAGERAAMIVADMLSFARPSHGESVTLNLVEEMKSAIRLAEKDYDQKRKLDFKQISIKEHYASNLPPIKAQKNKLRQVLLNLLINAAQALASQPDQNTPTISVSISRDAHAIRIDIEDNGPGMDANTRKRVFEPFFTTKPEGQGTGLGLSVSYFIVTEQLAGSLTVDSDVGKGARFTLRIPLPESKQREKQRQTSEQQYQLPLDEM